MHVSKYRISLACYVHDCNLAEWSHWSKHRVQLFKLVTPNLALLPNFNLYFIGFLSTEIPPKTAVKMRHLALDPKLFWDQHV